MRFRVYVFDSYFKMTAKYHLRGRDLPEQVRWNQKLKRQLALYQVVLAAMLMTMQIFFNRTNCGFLNTTRIKCTASFSANKGIQIMLITSSWEKN